MSTRRAFTLIELLVVCAIIVALIAIVLPSMGRARDIAIRTACASNTRQQALGFMNYAVDYKGYYPTADNKNKGGNQWTLNCLYVMSNSHGRAMSERGFITDNPDIAGDPVPDGTIMRCPANTALPRGFLTYTLLHVDQYIILTDLRSGPYSFTGTLSPVRMGDAGPMTACHTSLATTGATWAGYHPGRDGQPAGFPQSFSDLSARWIDRTELPLNGNKVPTPRYNSGWPWNWTWRDGLQ
jgi:prepilin-type N-terminal cleavage/methylation domain-containing protein